MNLNESVFEKATADNDQEIKEKRDHKGKPISKIFKRLGGLLFFECPVGYIYNDTNMIIELLTMEEKPPLIFKGTWLDQPYWYIEAVQIYHQERNKWLAAQKT